MKETMKVYRFVPNSQNYEVIDRTIGGRWWPEGINLGSLMENIYPQSLVNDVWEHEGNHYTCDYPDRLADFPGFALHCPVVSARAAEVLLREKLVTSFVPMQVSGIEYYAIQPALTLVDKSLPNPFLAEKSEGIVAPSGDVFHYYSRCFDTKKVTQEFFTIPELEPFSDLYVTEHFVKVVQDNHLSGLENLELVYDNEPVVAKYPTVEKTNIPEFTFRRTIEWELFSGRADLMAIDLNFVRSAVLSEVCLGHICFE